MATMSAPVPAGAAARDRWGAPYGVLHRASLQAVLLDAVRREPLCTLRMGERIETAEAALAIAPAHRGATEYYGELKVERGDMAGARLMLAALDRTCAYGCAEAEELRRWIDAGGEPGL